MSQQITLDELLIAMATAGYIITIGPDPDPDGPGWTAMAQPQLEQADADAGGDLVGDQLEEKAPLEERACEKCGEAFAPRRKDQRYCSAKCRQRGNYHAKRKKEETL